MSDPKYLQTGFTKQLAHVVEECGEVMAAAGKTQRWGVNSTNPELPEGQRETNGVWLYRELTDLAEAVDRLKTTMVAERLVLDESRPSDRLSGLLEEAQTLLNRIMAHHVPVTAAEWLDGEQMLIRLAQASHALAFKTQAPPKSPELEPWQSQALAAAGFDTKTFTTLREANRARQVEWDKDAQITAAYRGNELAGEVGEACNVIKKLERELLGIAGSRSDVAALASELADVNICTDLIAMHYGIDLEVATTRKFNATSAKMGLKTRLDLLSADERCMACGLVLQAGDPIYDDASGGVLHANCCGPERESYTRNDEPLGPDDPIPEPDIWSLDGSEPAVLTREQFLIVLAHRLINRAGLDHDQAADHAASILDGYLDTEGVEYGGKPEELSWNAAGARELADEELSHWEG